jgi:hypothetical protein
MSNAPDTQEPADTKEPARPSSRWATGKRRDLGEAEAKKAGYRGALREEKGWFRGARVR